MSSLFGEECYPTPPELGARMLKGITISSDDSILEPSAGKGDLVKAILKKLKEDSPYRCDGESIDVIEIEPDLQKILKENQYRLIHDDFLTFQTMKRYSLIVMNPPFSEGDKHLTKALDLLKPGGTCVCLLNIATLENLHTNLRKALSRRLDEWNASFTRISGAFKSAQRKTGVDISLIQVTRPANEVTVSILLDTLQRAEERKYEVHPEQKELIDSDPIRAAIARFNQESKLGYLFCREFQKISPILQDRIFESDKELSDFDLKYHSMLKLKTSPDDFLKAVRKKYWVAFFNTPIITDQLTSNLQSELHGRVDELQDYDFSEFNIQALKCEISKRVLEGVEATIIALFDEMSAKHAWLDETSKNIHYFDGWATNKVWKINTKVILPLYGIDKTTWNHRLQFSYQAKRKIQDIEKVLGYLDGGIERGADAADILEWAERSEQTKKIQLRYTDVTFYKKGTVHFEFRDMDLLHRFNIFGCQRKKWLPPSYGKKDYEDLSPEEKTVVDSFEGEASYRDTYKRRDEMILDVQRVARLLLGLTAT